MGPDQNVVIVYMKSLIDAKLVAGSGGSGGYQYVLADSLDDYRQLGHHQTGAGISGLIASYVHSGAFCSRIASILFHEALHAKIGNATTGECEHAAIYNTTSKKDCETATLYPPR